MKSKSELKIPLDKLSEGADLCLENAAQFCADANALIQQSSYEHALGLCIFAIEELGKAILLKSKAEFARKESRTDVFLGREKPESLFGRTTKDLNAKGFKCKKGKEILQEV